MIINTQTKRSGLLNSDDNLIPLINIVFLMLVFFMVAGQITRPDALKLAPPSSISEAKTGEFTATVELGSEGDLYLDAQPITLETLGTELTAVWQGVEDQEAFEIVLKTDATLSVSALTPVLAAIKQEGFQKVRLATQLAPAPEGTVTP